MTSTELATKELVHRGTSEEVYERRAFGLDQKIS